MELPPGFGDDSPLSVPPSQSAWFIATDLRRLAEQIDLLDTDPAELTGLETPAGRLLLEAWQRDLIPPTYPELRDLIAWHAQPDPLFKGEPQRVRGPLNLFIDVCGRLM